MQHKDLDPSAIPLHRQIWTKSDYNVHNMCKAASSTPWLVVKPLETLRLLVLVLRVRKRSEVPENPTNKSLQEAT